MIAWTIADWEMTPPLTGGQLICWKHYTYLRERGLPVRIVDRRRAWGLAAGSRLVRNLWYAREIRRARARLVVENATQRNDFLLANILLRPRPRTRILALALEPLDGPAPLWRAWLRRFLFAAYFRQADAVVVLSETTKAWVVSHGVPAEKVRVIAPGVREFPSGDDAEPDAEAAAVDGSVRIVCVSHIRRDKGQECLLEAMKLLGERPWELWLVGAVKEPEYRRKLDETIAGSGLAGRVRFTGPLDGAALRGAYRTATVFVMPTLREAYGMALVEAMREGVPVVASAVGGIPEIVRDGVEGVLVPPGEPEILASAIAELLDRPALRREMGRRAREHARSLPSWAAACDRFYETVIALMGI